MPNPTLRNRRNRMHTLPLNPTALALVAACVAGCAASGQNQYAYAPPLAPPVYPQPQSPAPPPVTPVMDAPAAAVPISGAVIPGAVPPNAMLPAGAVVTGQPIVSQTVMADPCCQPVEGGAMPVVHESIDQSPQCPPGP